MDQDLSLEVPIRRGYADTLTTEERQALIKILVEDLSLRVGNNFSNDFTAELMLRALEDAKGE